MYVQGTARTQVWLELGEQGEECWECSFLYPGWVSLSKLLSLSMLLCPCCWLWASQTRFWVPPDVNPSCLSLYVVHFDHNLKNSHKSVFWVFLMIPALSKAVDFTTVCVCFCSWLVPKWRPRKLGHAWCRKIFSVVWIKKRAGQVNHPRYWGVCTPLSGPWARRSVHACPVNGIPLSHLSLPSWLEAGLAVVCRSSLPPSPLPGSVIGLDTI